MRKLALLALAMAIVVSASGQGTIIFANNATTLVSTNDDVNSGPALSSASPRVALYYSSAAQAPPIDYANIADLTGWTLASPTTAVNVGVPLGGRFTGTRTCDNLPAGGNVWLMVRGWTGGFAD